MFVRKLWELFHGLQTLNSYGLDLEYMRKYQDWDDIGVLNLDYAMSEVKLFNRNRQINFGVVLDDKSPALEIARLYRACIEHYDDYVPRGHKIRKLNISIHCDNMLEIGVCTEFRDVCELYWCTGNGMQRRESQMTFLMSDEAFRLTS